MAITPSQQAQKDRARDEAEHHLNNSAVDGISQDERAKRDALEEQRIIDDNARKGIRGYRQLTPEEEKASHEDFKKFEREYNK